MTPRRRHYHLFIVIAYAAILRVALFHHVGVWGDYGFYVYDARLILRGGTPFIDFLGRSPLFNYAYAAFRGVVGRPITSVRVFISLLWLATTLPVYYTTREIHSHHAGIAAAALFALSPFALVYGMWANTQSLAALLAATACLAILRRESPGGYAVAGALFAFAYLSRRSIVVVAGAVGLWTIWRYTHHRDTQAFALRAVAATATGFTALFGVYAAMAGFNPTDTLALFETHTLNLFLSGGRGGYPLIHANNSYAPIVTNQVNKGRIPIFNDICQMCGAWTAHVFAKTFLVVLPSAGVATYYVRDIIDDGFTPAGTTYLFGVTAILIAYAAIQAALAGFHLRSVAAIAFLGFLAVIYYTDSLDHDRLYTPGTVLMLAILGALTAGYLYRNRLLHTYYFMDFWPYLSVAAGILYVELWPGLRPILKAVFIVSVVLSSITAVGYAQPFTDVTFDDNDNGWFTMENLQDYNDDITSRTEPGDTVYTTSPAFLAGTNVSTINDEPRLHMVLIRYQNTGPGEPLYRDIIRHLETGEAEYVIYTRTSRTTFRFNETAWRTFRSNYCRVHSADELYQRANAYLFRYQPEDCHPRFRPRWTLPLYENDTGARELTNVASNYNTSNANA